MEKENLIKRLKEYLQQKEVKYYPDSLTFKGERKDVPQPDGSTRDLYAISYMVSVNNNQFDSDAIYYAYFDPKTKKLLHIIGPQYYEIIEEK